MTFSQTVAEWKAHLKAMADRRAGRLDPHAAMLRWMSAYEKAPFRISAYKQIDQRLQHAETCRVDCHSVRSTTQSEACGEPAWRWRLLVVV
ncbi:hypothetical protein [Actinopolymorpha singaporensis]|uniref:Uncharacterized protein n=1 Tax=Actinopolymorpha singaporensis TaxID=117157 RepID=A0A1H1LPI6_9ACTN|nr:hypothetical protein [Actinopolymorpha singaporensis]SDR76478.1 hypothetical protein SAMN04489717_0458 [Actinopolymorpha singaporensis]